jgi:hypothetical protein
VASDSGPVEIESGLTVPRRFTLVTMLGMELALSRSLLRELLGVKLMLADAAAPARQRQVVL